MDFQLTGITRPIDKLGRIVIPKELRDVHHLEVGDRVEFGNSPRGIMIAKQSPACDFCGKLDAHMKIFKGKKICPECLSELKEEL